MAHRLHKCSGDRVMRGLKADTARKTCGRVPVLTQHKAVRGEQVCNQPCVTANRRAPSRESNSWSNRKMRWWDDEPWPLDTATEAPKRPESVRCVEGETTYLPEEKVFSEIKKKRESEQPVSNRLRWCCKNCRQPATPQGNRIDGYRYPPQPTLSHSKSGATITAAKRRVVTPTL